VTPKNINEFKKKVLTGIYLMMWSHYSSTVSNLMNSTLVELFQRDLQVSSPQKMSDTLFDASLEALSQYCSFAYQNRNERIYDNLIRRLGKTVQADIHALRHSREKQETSFYDIYKGIMRTLGLNSVF
ncbi:lpg1752 family Dot/Icm T4SS effector, partial [Legionella pneumophila serogroup 1]